MSAVSREGERGKAASVSSFPPSLPPLLDELGEEDGDEDECELVVGV